MSADVVIDLEVKVLGQLFHSLDPSPFQERALDEAAVQWIVGWARDHPLRTPVMLRIRVTREPVDEETRTAVASAVRADFAWRAASARRDLRTELWQGRMSLLIAVLFMSGCVMARELIVEVGPVSHILREGLAIVGWVAMWQPIHAFLYGWWPILARARLLEKLRDMAVDVRPS